MAKNYSVKKPQDDLDLEELLGDQSSSLSDETDGPDLDKEASDQEAMRALFAPKSMVSVPSKIQRDPFASVSHVPRKPLVKSKVTAIKPEEKDPEPIASQEIVNRAPSGDMPDFNKFMVTPEDYQAVRESQRAINAAAAVGAPLANIQGFGNAYLGRPAPHQDVAGNLKPLADQAGNLVSDKRAMLAQELEKPEIKYAYENMTPDSQTSQAKRAVLIGGINVLSTIPGMGVSVEPLKSLDIAHMSGFQVDKILKDYPSLAKASELSLQNQKNQAMVAMAGRRLDNADRNFNFNVEKTGAKEAGSIATNPIMQNLKQREIQIGIDKHTIEMGGVINSSVAAELATGLANAFGGGKGAGLGQSEKQELHSLQGDLAKANGYLTGTPQEQWTPDQRKFVIQTFDRAEKAFKLAQQSQAKVLGGNKAIFSSPKIQGQIQKTVEGYNQPSQAGSEPKQDPKVSDYAQQHDLSYEQASSILKGRGYVEQ